MSVDDPDKKPLNQTRFGTPTGHANERQMLDSRADTFGIRTIIKQNADGTETMCRTHAGMPRFFTDEAPTSTEPEDTCPLTDVGFVNSNFNVGGVYPTTEHLDWKLYNLFGRDGAIKQAKYARNTSGKKNQLMYYGASLFSGLMRRVVQLHNGKASEDVWFSPGWSVTDGLFIGVGNYGKITRYVIRVDNTGVWRIPITFCKELPSTWQTDETNWLSSLTEQQAHDKIAPYWTPTFFDVSNKVKIADAPSLYADGWLPFYQWCGWAFNYTGSKATVVLVNVIPGDLWYTNRLYEMTITDTAGVPTSASFSVVNQGRFVNPYNDALPAGYPAIHAATTIPGILATVPIHSDAGAGDQDSPVFSYYNRAGGMVVVGYRQKSAGSTSTTDDLKTYERVYVQPTGTFANTYFNTTLGIVVTDPVTPTPNVDLGYGTYGGTGIARRTVSGVSGKIEPCFVTPYTSAQESHNRTVSEVEFEDAGFGREFRSGPDQSRFPGEYLLWCVFAGLSSLYRKESYPYPWWTSTGNQYTSTRQVNYCWQVQRSYNETKNYHGVLLLHGCDRESYAVAEYNSVSKGVTTYSKNTQGPFGNTIIPTDSLKFIDTWGREQTFAPTGPILAGPSVEGRSDTAIGGHGPANVIGQVCSMVGPINVDGGSGSEPATSNTTRSITTVVGGSAFTEQITGTHADVFTTYVSGDFFRFRACAAAFNPDRIVRQIELNDTSLLTENLGGCRPSANITTFIGVI